MAWWCDAAWYATPLAGGQIYLANHQLADCDYGENREANCVTNHAGFIHLVLFKHEASITLKQCQGKSVEIQTGLSSSIACFFRKKNSVGLMLLRPSPESLFGLLQLRLAQLCPTFFQQILGVSVASGRGV